MRKTLHKAREAPRTAGLAAANRRIELRRLEGIPAKIDAPDAADVMIDPLHPMHQQLLARYAVPVVRHDPRDDQEGLSRSARMAVIFYAALAAWGLCWLLLQVAKPLI